MRRSSSLTQKQAAGCLWAPSQGGQPRKHSSTRPSVLRGAPCRNELGVLGPALAVWYKAQHAGPSGSRRRVDRPAARLWGKFLGLDELGHSRTTVGLTRSRGVTVLAGPPDPYGLIGMVQTVNKARRDVQDVNMPEIPATGCRTWPA